MYKFFIFFIALFVAMPVFAYTASTTNSYANKNSQASGQEVQQLLQLQDKIDAAINTINDSIANIKVGSEIKIDDRVLAMSEQVKKLIEKWDDACSKKAQKPNGALRVESIRPTIGSNSHHKCIIEKCDENKGFERTSNKLECKESKAHADCVAYDLGTWMLGKCKCKYGENDDGCMTKELAEKQKQQQKQEKKDEKQQQSVEKLKNEIDKSIANMKIGATMPYHTELLNNPTYKTAMNNWKQACSKYVKSDAVHGQTPEYQTSKNKITCLIQDCAKDYYLADSKSCVPRAQHDCESDELKTWENNKCACKYGQDENNKCKTKDKSKQDKKATKDDKKYEKEIEKIYQALVAQVDKLVKECNGSGKTISENGECIEPAK